MTLICGDCNLSEVSAAGTQTCEKETSHARLQEDVLRLQIAVYEPCVFQNGERVQKLGREDLDQLRAEALELVLFDELVQVDAQQLHRNAQVVTEVEVLLHLDDMVLFVGILGTKLAIS